MELWASVLVAACSSIVFTFATKVWIGQSEDVKDNVEPLVSHKQVEDPTELSRTEDSTDISASQKETPNDKIKKIGSINAKSGIIFDRFEQPFTKLLILSAATMSFAHGANNVGNSAGPFAGT